MSILVRNISKKEKLSDKFHTNKAARMEPHKTRCFIEYTAQLKSVKAMSVQFKHGRNSDFNTAVNYTLHLNLFSVMVNVINKS